MIFNSVFEPNKLAYDVAYDNALHHSAHFRSFAEKLAEDLCRRHGLQGKNVVEIGCGDGFFLNLLCKQGRNQGRGFDPSAYPKAATDSNVHLIQGYFSADSISERLDLICCRHVLEHLPKPGDLLREIRNTCVTNETVVFFEVPDAQFTFDRGGFWDILYEHCSYYTPQSLRRLFEEEGFEVLRIESAYHGQFLQIEAVAVPTPNWTRGDLQEGDYVNRLSRFNEQFQDTVGYWRERLEALGRRGNHVALWGAGTKGVMFLNAIGRNNCVSCIVDINPDKQGTFVAGTTIPVVAPKSLGNDPPALVLLMNPAYEAEVAASLSALGISPQISCVNLRVDRAARQRSENRCGVLE